MLSMHLKVIIVNTYNTILSYRQCTRTPEEWERRMQCAYTLRGFLDADHKMVCAELE